jgi:Fe(3+) dicitrate transport protein
MRIGRSNRVQGELARARSGSRAFPKFPLRGILAPLDANISHLRDPVLAAACLALIMSVAMAEQPKLPTTDTEASESQDGRTVGAPDDSAVEDPEESGTPEARPQTIVEERVQVVGSKNRARDSTGSEAFIGEEELARHAHTDVQRILRRVPGIYLQDEEGYGLRPNIGLRGTGVERSQKVTLMEDGVLIAPAPYAAPSAYYFPTAGRMESIEVSKGPASIRQGPYTTGGVLNMVSRGIPTGFSGFGELASGDDGSRRGRLGAGDSSERFGWLVETFRQETDGFKRLDTGGDTGFDLEDYGARLRFNSAEGARKYQSLEFKLGITDQEGDEPYLGLTQDDFDRDPYRRYSASSMDAITTEHEQARLRHFIVPDPDVDVTTTVYHNDFFRNWHKLQSVAGAGIGNILAAPDAPAFEGLIEVIRGEVDSVPGDLKIRNNRRDYYSRGVESHVGLRLEAGSTRHEIEIGVRYHEDEEDRFQEEDEFQMVGGSMQLTALGAPGSQSNRVTRADALAVFVRDSIEAGNWRVEPGFRFESVDFTRLDYGKTDPGRTGANLSVQKNGVDEVIPGVGVTYDATERVSVFGGVHKGFAPPGPGQDGFTDAEESYNYELGVRVNGAWHFQAVGFYNDYDNLLGRDTLSGSGGGTGEQFNGGQVEVRGLELSFDHDLAGGEDNANSVPVQFAYTYTHGEFRNSFETSFADWAPEVLVGDELPYLPEHQLFAEIGWRNTRWGTFLSGSYVDEMRTNAGQGAIPEAESIEDHLVFDLSGEYRFLRHYRAFIQVRNLSDEVYVAARRPAGLRPGLPRTFLTGFGVQF